MRSDDDFSSRPTKRRRISHQSGSPSSSVFPTGPRSAQYYEDSDYLRFASLPTHQSSSPASQTVARMRQCSPEDIVDTSDNEERLFLHHSEIYRSDRSSPTTYHASSERSAQFSSPKFVVDSPQIEKSTEKLALVCNLFANRHYCIDKNLSLSFHPQHHPSPALLVYFLHVLWRTNLIQLILQRKIPLLPRV